MQPFLWTKRREQAAVLVAEDRQSDEQVAGALGINKCTLERWKKHPDFRERVAELVAEFREAVRARGIAEKQNRIDDLNEVRNRLWRVFDERAIDMPDVAGGQSGLLVRTYKVIGGGETAMLREEFAVDTGALRELREYLKQAAIEVKEWAERRELSGPDGGPLVVEDLSAIKTGDLIALIAAIKPIPSLSSEGVENDGSE